MSLPWSCSCCYSVSATKWRVAEADPSDQVASKLCDHRNVTVQLKPEQEQLIGLAIQAGLIKPVDDVLEVGVETIRRRWARELHAWVRSHPIDTPLFSDEHISRIRRGRGAIAVLCECEEGSRREIGELRLTPTSMHINRTFGPRQPYLGIRRVRRAGKKSEGRWILPARDPRAHQGILARFCP